MDYGLERRQTRGDETKEVMERKQDDAEKDDAEKDDAERDDGYMRGKDTGEYLQML